MEFPKVGSHCAVASCKLNDFLPFCCVHCQATFCKDHFNVLSHNCPQKPDNIIQNPESSSTIFLCSEESCKLSSPLAMNCIKCLKHFCLAHRFHGCLEESDLQIEEKSKLWQRSNDEFEAAKNIVDAKINEKLKKPKNSAMANKVQLMRLKGRATGVKAIPPADRKYFLIYPPLSTKKQSQPIFVCNHWTIGKAIDSIADLMNIKNCNNQTNSAKLRLFHHSSGLAVADTMDVPLSDLFNHANLIDGESLILEYSNVNKLDYLNYK